MATFSVKGFNNTKKYLNFLKQGKNWDEIFEEAFETYSMAIEDTAQSYLNKKVNNVTGDLSNSIVVYVNGTELVIGSTHKAAKLIDKGGPSPFPYWGSETIKEYADYYGMPPFLLAKAIYKNQPFLNASNFSRNAMIEYMDDIKDEIKAIAIKRANEA
tara:strand:+ start:90 stop:563 length:474 start_codon:yes stop_codon:yes gene_type:complete